MKDDDSRSELTKVLLSFKSQWKVALVLSIVAGLLGLTSTVYMLQVYDRVVNSRNVMTLVMLTLVALGAYAVMEILEKIRSKLLWSLGAQFDMRLGKRIYDAMFSGLAGGGVGRAMAVQSDQRIVRDFFSNPAITAVMELPISIVSLVLIFLINPFMALAASFMAIFQTLMAWLTQSNSRKPLLEAQQRSQEAQLYADASLRNAEVMESMGMMKSVMARWQEKQNDFLAQQATASEVAGNLTAWTKLLQQLLGSVMLGLGAYLAMQGTLRGGPVMMIISSVLGGRMLMPMGQIVQQWSQIVTAFQSWKRLDALLREVPDAEPKMPLPPPKGNLVVEGLVASPPGMQFPVIRGVQFALPAAHVLAVVGPSASGKTSLARLLVGVWSPQAGKVRLDGVDVHFWDKRELGPYLGYLPQGVELLDGTLAENICRFGEVDMDKVRHVAQLVGLHELIMSMPEGYETQVGREGGVLSGGQRQRVALARALYGNPVFVVLDEPNSSLDEAGDQALVNAIVAMKSRGTTFVINTHRANVLAIADRMLVLREGAQQLYGETAEVMQKLMPARPVQVPAATALTQAA